MRHNVSILLGTEQEPLSAELTKYIYKYAEGRAEQYDHVRAWLPQPDGSAQVMKGEIAKADGKFVSTTQCSARLAFDTTIDAANKQMGIRLYFKRLHTELVNIANGGDSPKLLVSVFVPLYDNSLASEMFSIIEALNLDSSLFSVLVFGYCHDMRDVLSAPTAMLTAQQEMEMLATQRDVLVQLSKLRFDSQVLEQVVVMQNRNAEGFALNLDAEALVRIVGEFSLLTVEQYDTIFPATLIDKDHPLCTFGMSVLNLDKYYFDNYLLQRSYLHILKREGIDVRNVDINKVAIIADTLLKQHRKLFSDFYAQSIKPLLQEKLSHNQIISQTADKLKDKLRAVGAQLTEDISKEELSLPEKEALLAMLLGYDNQLLSGNLFNQDQLTLDNLYEEVAEVFTSANNLLSRVARDADGNLHIVNGPLTKCCDDEGNVHLPIKELQQRRYEMREVTNYIRQKSKELDEIEGIREETEASNKRLTKEGFVIDGNVYRFDIEHQEVEFEETYAAHAVTERNIDLRSGFTPIKDQGQIGACTVFSVASLFEYILKKNQHKNFDLSELFVYYNVRKKNDEVQNDTGSSYRDVITSIGTEGICSEELHPYSKGLHGEPSSEAYDDAKTRRITKALNVKVSESDIKSAVQEGYPVAISLKVYESFSSTTFGGQGSNVGVSGFVSYPTNDELADGEFGWHAMVIVGYSDDDRYFVVRNSWGEKFGDKGYCYIPYSYICDTDLNRMACIVTEVDAISADVKTIVGGRVGTGKIVQFNMNDANIRQRIIENLIHEEELSLKVMQSNDLRQRQEYESLMQQLGQNSMRKRILEATCERLAEQIEKEENERDRINNEERPAQLKKFEKDTLLTRIWLLVLDVVMFAVVWFLCAEYFDEPSSTLLYFVLGTSVAAVAVTACTVFYWRQIRSRRRALENDLEAASKMHAHRADEYKRELAEAPLRFHIAGMVVDNLLSLKTELDSKYNVMKSYVGNLSVWLDEEEKASEAMEPLVKNPFVPLLRNDKLDEYFSVHSDDITGGVRLYKLFAKFKLDEESIVEYKKELKEQVLSNIESKLNDFSIFRYAYGIKNYPYLDSEYASAANLMPELNSRSVMFSQLFLGINHAQSARFLFVNPEPDKKLAWEQDVQKYFTAKPTYADICSKYKVMDLRLQPVSAAEVLGNE